MKTVFTLAKKEITDWLTSPLALVFLIAFLGLSHWLFFNTLFEIYETTLRPFFIWVPLLWMAFLPALTMDRWSLEKKQNTLEFLKSLPVTQNQILFAKFFASFVLMLITLIFTIPLAIVVANLGDLELGPVLTSYLGCLIFGAFGISLGLWFSKQFYSSITAYLLTFLSLALFYTLAHPLITKNLSLSLIPYFESISLNKNFEPFLLGILSLKSILFFLWGTFCFLFLQTESKNKKQNLLKGIFIILLFIFMQSTPSSWFFDATEDGEHTLSQNTKNILKKLDDRLVIKLYFSKNLPPLAQKLTEQLTDILKDFKKNSAQDVILQEQDVTSPLGQERARQLGVEPLMLTVKTLDSQKTQEFYMGLSLHYQDKMDVLPFVTQSSNFEYRLALSLLKLTSKKLPRLGLWLSENQKKESTALLNILDQLTKVMDFSNSQTDWDNQNLNAMIIVDPQNVSESFTLEIENLLNKKIPVLIFLSHSQISKNVKQSFQKTGLENLLQNHGIAVSKELVLDNDYNVAAQFQIGTSKVNLPYPFWLQILPQNLNSNHAVTTHLEELMLPWSHALLFDDKKIKASQIQTLVKSSKESFLQEKENLSVSPQYISQMKDLPHVQSYNIAAEVRLQKNQAPLFLMSNTQFLKDDFLNPNFLPQAFSNMTFLANLVEYTTWGDELIAIRSRGKTKRPLKKLTPSEKNSLLIVMMSLQVFLPILFLGIVVLMKKQKHKKWKSLVLKK